MLNTDIFGLTKRGDDFRKFSDHLEKYTARRLTYDSGSINAFRGVLAKSDFYTYWGIPIACANDSKLALGIDQLNVGLARGLNWTPSSIDGRPTYLSRTFPRWSWAGWKGC